MTKISNQVLSNDQYNRQGASILWITGCENEAMLAFNSVDISVSIAFTNFRICL